MKFAVLTSTIALALAAPAMAGVNLITNGSFETGNLSGFVQFGDTSFTDVQPSLYQPATDGIYQADFGPLEVGGISQTITHAAGSFTVSFDLGNLEGLGNSVDFGGTTLVANIPEQHFTHYSFTVSAAANPTLSFTFHNPDAYYTLDNIVVTATASDVPEPAAWMLMIAGFGLVGAAARRRRPVALAA